MKCGGRGFPQKPFVGCVLRTINVIPEIMNFIVGA